MRLVLRVEEGPDQSLSYMVEAGRSVLVGSARPAAFVLGKDPTVAKVHFCVEHLPNLCRIRDLGSPTGTFVNGQRVTAATLNDGDTITCGKTTIRVARESTPAPVREVPVKAPEAVVAAAAAAAAVPAVSGAIRLAGIERLQAETRPVFPSAFFDEAPCESGVALFTVPENAPKPLDVATWLATKFTVCLILDFNRAEFPCPDGITKPAWLFDWLPPEAVHLVSPAWIPFQKGDNRTGELLDSCFKQGWGKDSMICLAAREDPATLLEHMRRMVNSRAPAAAPSVRDTALGCHSPRVLSMLFQHYTTQFANTIMSRLEAVLVESPENAEAWQIFARSSFASQMEKAGWQPRPKPEEEEGKAEEKPGKAVLRPPQAAPG